MHRVSVFLLFLAIDLNRVSVFLLFLVIDSNRVSVFLLWDQCCSVRIVRPALFKLLTGRCNGKQRMPMSCLGLAWRCNGKQRMPMSCLGLAVPWKTETTRLVLAWQYCLLRLLQTTSHALPLIGIELNPHTSSSLLVNSCIVSLFQLSPSYLVDVHLIWSNSV